ncbi:hypothetical protein TRFO_28481 [Tritrichomonas foetus]|uniref:Uncharacterized protein n=1 Tax=Tritrichomonas foetus TaxID=1144522 RepID=A0A1J4K2S8_9EUKA|nr:hypothetical protein TRFO_28481 [Tritrichomonas foetus]|eukprot:OHT04052.1 hypothetical protein TRFO_28481 [Tritrichomonas foetus]
MTITNTNNSNFSSPFTSSLSSPEETQQNQYFNFSLINQQQQQSQQQENDIAKESESENVELVASADNLNESFCFDEMLTLFDNDQYNEFTDDVYDHDFYCIEL